MGESFTQAVVEGPQPKPSRFQFVPVPGEFTRGRWKCRDSYHPNAETLEFEKNKSKEEETNPDKISVFFKLRQQQQEPEPEPEPPQPPPQESTIQVTSVKSTRPDTGDPGDSEVVTTDSTESIIITRKNGVTIVRKTSNSLLLPDEKYDQIRQLSIDDFENKEKKQQVPPTPMNTPPASLAVVDTSIQSTTSETTPGHSSSRKPSKEDSSPFDASSATPAPSQLETPQQQKPTTTRHFQVEPVVLSEPSTPAPVAPAPSIETLTSTSPPVTQQLAPSLSEPTFQVIQTEESKNMSMDSVKNVVDAAALSAPAPAPLSQSDRLNHVDEVEGTTPSNVMITVSSAAAALEKKEEAAFAAAGSLDSCGIPISGGGAAAQTSAPHSTPYGTPKDTHIQQQQQPVVFEEILTANGPPPQPSSPLLPALITTTTSAPTIAPASSPIINASGSSIPAASTSGISLFPSGGVTSSLTTPSTTADTHTPIDNKIEQAMELVKTHLTYAVREEVDTLRNTIAELEYQMRESQYECTYYRQNCAPDLIEQASSFVHQQMASHQRPAARRAVSTAGIFDGSSSGGGGGQASSGASASASSAHMRNLQNQIQQMKQMAPTVLMVAEKPLLADSIANLLSNGQAKKRKGWNGVCSVSEYDGQFNGRAARFKVTSTCGHVMSLDFPPKFNNWERVDPAELYSAPTQRIEANPKMKMNEFLASEAKNADFLVLWLDCDKEGENICFEVIDAVKCAMFKNRQDFMSDVYRAHFSAITEKDIKAAMRNLGRPDQNMSHSVDARQELDLRIGCSFTRFQTKFFQGKYGDLDSNVISYGPCQTPTLGFCVTRHDQIVQFKPEQYWVLKTNFTTSDDGQIFSPEWQRGRIFDAEVARVFVDRIKKCHTGLVLDVSKKEARKERPCALNTVELMRVASSSLGMSPSTTMHVAEALYTQGYISYPRTETTAYSANFDLTGTLKILAGDRKWGSVVSQVLADGIKRPKSGVDKGDHPPITPMRPNHGGLSGDMSRIYEYVSQHFVATLMKQCVYEVTTVKMSCGDEQFTLQGKNVVEPGFTAVMPWLSVEEECSVPKSLQQIGAKIELQNAEIQARETTPPGYLTEAELITLMEKHGIGTDASIPVHINTITQRNYVTVESGRRLVPTRLGQCLVRGYWKVDPELVLPTMRAELEEQLNLVASGKADYLDVKNHALKMFEMKFQYFVTNIPAVDTLFEASFTTLSDTGKPFSRCGKCRRYMKLVQTKPQRLYCPTCQETYAVPNFKDGVLKVIGDHKCPLDDFDVILYQGPGGKLARTFTLCPFCFNNPPFEKMPQGAGCDTCVHPSCQYSISSNGVCGCLQDCGGVMLLDTQSHPKWRMTCNKCPSVVGLFEGAIKVKVDSTRSCEQCDAQFIKAEFKPNSGKPGAIEYESSSYEGCIFCDAMKKYPDAINLNHAYLTEESRQRNTQAPRRGGGGGRGRGGRGRGGRGRGRGRGR